VGMARKEKPEPMRIILRSRFPTLTRLTSNWWQKAGKVAMEERADVPGMADEAATAGRAAPASAANASQTASAMAVVAAPRDPEAPAALVAEVATEATAVRPDTSRSSCRREITIWLASGPLAAQVAVVAEESPARAELVEQRACPALEESGASMAVATDVTERRVRLVVQAGPDGTALREIGDIGAIQVRLASLYSEEPLGRTL